MLEMIVWADFSDLWDLGDYAREKQRIHAEKGHRTLHTAPITHYNRMSDELIEIRKNRVQDDGVIVTKIKYKRQHFPHLDLPKQILNAHAGRNKIPRPIYETVREERLFRSIITFQGKKYTSIIWERCAKHAEQNAALVCCYHLGFYEKDFLIETEMLFE